MSLNQGLRMQVCLMKHYTGAQQTQALLHFSTFPGQLESYRSRPPISNVHKIKKITLKCRVFLVCLFLTHAQQYVGYPWLCTQEPLGGQFGILGIDPGKSLRQTPHPLYCHSGPQRRFFFPFKTIIIGAGTIPQ